MLRVSKTLADFLTKQTIFNTYNINAVSQTAEEPSKQGDVYNTLQKGQDAAPVYEGYLTPPPTPSDASADHLYMSS